METLWGTPNLTEPSVDLAILVSTFGRVRRRVATNYMI